MLNIFQNDAFSVVSLTAAVNKMDHVPGRAGDLAFAGVGEGVTTTSVAIEQQDGALSLISTAQRGAPPAQNKADKRTLEHIGVPHIPLDDTIRADEVQNVRAFGSPDQTAGVQTVVNQRLAKMVGRHDLTLENLRLGALRGQIIDADGTTVLVDLYAKFGVTAPDTVAFALGTNTTKVRQKCHQVTRIMRQNAKMVLPSTARVHAFVDGNFMDKLVEHPEVKGVYDGYEAAERRLGGSYVEGIFEFGGIFFEEYRGSDDGAVGIGANSARFFWTGVPGMYAEYYSPGDFIEAVNTVGLPRYAKIAADPSGFNRFVAVHTQQNPLPLCLRPKTLVGGSTN